jgi:hypothetical protein
MKTTDIIKPFLLLPAIILTGLFPLAAQENEAEIKDVNLFIETAMDLPGLRIAVLFDLDETLSMDTLSFPYKAMVTLMSDEYDEFLSKLNVSSKLSYRARGFSCLIPLYNNALIDLLRDSPESFYLVAGDTLRFTTFSGTGLYLGEEELSAATLGKIRISDAQRQELQETLAGNLYLYVNYFDVGFNPQAEKFDLSLSYLFSRSYPVKGLGLSFFSQGRLSTNPADTLNYFVVYPVNFSFMSEGNTWYNIRARTGLESDQIFSTARISLGVNFETIIPNLIDLSYGYNRLRLKPVVTAGLNFYNEIRLPDDRAKQNAFLLSGEIYYYIPVIESYYFLIHAKTFYDTGRDVEDAWDYHASLALGLELKSVPARIIAKYVFGANEITFERDNQLLIGFAMDLFSAGKPLQ